jgi:hypothetical protein
MIGYIEEGEYKIEKPTPFNMEQEDLASLASTTSTTRWQQVSPPTLRA